MESRQRLIQASALYTGIIMLTSGSSRLSVPPWVHGFAKDQYSRKRRGGGQALFLIPGPVRDRMARKRVGDQIWKQFVRAPSGRRWDERAKRANDGDEI